MEMNRRDFLKAASAVGSLALFGYGYRPVLVDILKTTRGHIVDPDTPETEPSVHIEYSVCMQCHSYCGIKAKIKDGKILRLEGNPYHPNNRIPHLWYENDPKGELAIRHSMRLCPKGSTGIQNLYDINRIKQPLKRDGPRGSGKWKSISWDQAIREIVEGGNLFGEVQIEGLKSIRNYIDQESAANDPIKYSESLINKDSPELGPKSNQLVFLTGRLDNGRKAFVERFLKESYGSINLIENIANESHSVAFKLCLDGKHDNMKPDIMESQFLLYFGTSPLEANLPMNRMSRQISDFFKGKGGVLCVVDPRFSNTASKADIWVPIRPGTDGALAMAMIKWIIDNGRYDKTFLENANLNAARKDGETTFTDATYLVRLDNGMLLRAKDIGLGEDKESNQYVVWTDDGAYIAESVEHGILESDTVNINDIPCKPVFTLLKEEANRLNIDEYAEICGIREETIVELARGFTDHGKKAVADFFGGVAKHTNGVYSCRAIITLNFLIGNINWKGGLAIGGGHWSELGGTYVSRYNIKEMHPNKVQSWGVTISRSSLKYEDTSEYKSNGYPAKKPWFPFSTNNCQSAFAGIADQYPYSIKALIINNYNPVYSTPGMRKFIEETLKDTKKVPLFVSIDIKMSETNVYADYILPDVTYLERWGFPHLSPSVITKSNPGMKPVIDKVYPNTKSLEEILILLAKEMNLSGFGNNGFSDFIALNTPEDFYLKLVANIAYGDKIGEVLPGITENDKIEYVLSRGGRFENEEESYVGEYMRHKYTNVCRIYSEELATTNHSITGERFKGLPTYQPIKDMKGKSITDKQYPYHLITYKLVFHSNSITKDNSYLLEILHENSILINSKEATRLGIKNGDKVSIISATNKEGIIGKVKIIDGIRPDVIGISHHFGHLSSEEIIGTTPNPVMRLDTSLGIGTVSLEDPIGGSASYFDTKVKVIKM